MYTDHTFKIHRMLTPISCLYGIGVAFRNQLFDWNFLKSERYDLPIISVGNLAVGGTGKTPHTEYIIRLLKDRYKIAVLSRGYKRQTNGFILANDASTSLEIGDEPYQMKRKFPEILVAVDANRRRGIQHLLALPHEIRPQVILLDDAYQHRYVKPSLNILLSDSHRLFTRDALLPRGRLREPAANAKRANLIIVTKCEADMQANDFQVIEQEVKPSTEQEVFFSRIVYGDLQPVFEQKTSVRVLPDITPNTEVLLVSGIASPKPLEQEIRKYTKHIQSMAFPDHHAFSKEDIRRIHEAFCRLSSTNRIMITTEKDAARLRDISSLPEEWLSHLYCLPITIGFCQDKEKLFQEIIFKHIQSYEQQN